jgi:hypothetical protein
MSAALEIEAKRAEEFLEIDSSGGTAAAFVSEDEDEGAGAR